MSGARASRSAARSSRFRAASSSARCSAPASPSSRAYDYQGFFFESHSRSWSKTSSFDEWCTHPPCRRSNITLPHRLLFGTLFRARVAFLARLRLSGFQVLLRESFFAKLVEDSFFFFARRTAGARASRAAARLAISRAAFVARVDGIFLTLLACRLCLA